MITEVAIQGEGGEVDEVVAEELAEERLRFIATKRVEAIARKARLAAEAAAAAEAQARALDASRVRCQQCYNDPVAEAAAARMAATAATSGLSLITMSRPCWPIAITRIGGPTTGSTAQDIRSMATQVATLKPRCPSARSS